MPVLTIINLGFDDKAIRAFIMSFLGQYVTNVSECFFHLVLFSVSVYLSYVLWLLFLEESLHFYFISIGKFVFYYLFLSLRNFCSIFINFIPMFIYLLEFFYLSLSISLKYLFYLDRFFSLFLGNFVQSSSGLFRDTFIIDQINFINIYKVLCNFLIIS